MTGHDRNRRRIYWVPMHWVWDELVKSSHYRKQMLYIPRIMAPQGAHVEHVHANYEAKTFDFCVTHPDFDRVAEGELAPRFPAPLETGEAVQLYADDDRPLVHHLQKQLEEFRNLFADLRLDSPPVDAAYRRGLSDAADFVRKGDVTGVLSDDEAQELAIAQGNNAVLAVALRLMSQREAQP
jgi:hypothetical protein